MSEQARFFLFRSSPASKRWLVLLLASVLFHWAVIEWANGNLAFPLSTQQAEPIVTAKLHPVPINKSAQKPAPPPRKKPAPRPKRLAAPSLQETPVSIPEQALPTDDASAQASADAKQDGSALAEPGGGAETMPAVAAGKDKGRENGGADFALNLPPSAELKYDVHAQKKGLSYYGTGLINWQANGTRYLITGKAKAAFFTVLEFKSEGEIDKSGIAPILYAERAGNHAETNTHFHRERNTISFSASTLSYPRLGGEQDRASIIWQLAALGRANPELFKPGEELSIFVAGVRNAAPWRIYILGEEDVPLDGAPIRSWHVKSVPQQGGYEKTFDIWLASGYEWYPVKLRQTEASGDYLELTLSNLVIAHQ